MSIADKIQRLQTAKTNIATAITDKGGTVQSGDGFEDFSADIATIPSGGGTLYGLDVNDWIGTDNNGTLQNRDFTGKNELRFTGLKKFATSYAMAYRFYTNTNLPSMIFPDLEEISQYGLYYCFSNGSAQANAEFRMPKLKRVENYGLNYVCNGVLGINYVELGNSENEMAVTGSYNFTYGFYNCNLDNGFVVKGLKYLNISTACGYMFASVGTKTNWTEDTPVEFTDLVAVGGLSALQYVLKSRGSSEGKKWNVFPKLTTVNATTALTSAFRNMSFNATGSYPQKQHIITFPSLQTLAGNNVCSHFMIAINGKWKYFWFPMLKTIGVANSAQYGFFSSAFNGTAVNDYFEICFPELENIVSTSTSGTVSYACFASDTQIKKFWMPKLRNVTGTPNATYMFRNCNQAGLEIHFGIENQAYIEGLAGYASKFGATNATIYFDCVNHIVVNGTVYDRDGEHYITECPVIQVSGGAMTHPDDRYSWKDANGNVLYTLECWTPAVGDNVLDANDTVVGTIEGVS